MNNKGFSLIELIAVIVVMAIIAMIATPLIMKNIEVAHRAADNATVHSLNEMTKRRIVQLDTDYDNLFKDTTNDEEKYMIIRDDESAFPIPLQRGGRFTWDKENKEWIMFKISPLSYVSASNTAEHTRITHFNLPSDEKSIILNYTHTIPKNNTVFWGIHLYGDIPRELDEFKIIDLPDTINQDNRFHYLDNNQKFRNIKIKKLHLANYSFVYNSLFKGSTFDIVHTGNNSYIQYHSFGVCNIKKVIIGQGTELMFFAFMRSSVEEVIVEDNCILGKESLNVNNLKKITIGNNVTLYENTVHNSFHRKYLIHGPGTYNKIDNQWVYEVLP